MVLVDFFRGLNDKGQIVFHAGIDTGTTKIDGLFLANPIIPGDVNGDLVVNIFDINLVSSNWNKAGSAGDANGDGIVNIFDINLISSHWGEMAGCGAGGGTVAVPEPPTLWLAVLAFVLTRFIGSGHIRSGPRRRRRQMPGAGAMVHATYARGASAVNLEGFTRAMRRW